MMVDTLTMARELKADIERAPNQLLIWVMSTQIAVSGPMIILKL